MKLTITNDKIINGALDPKFKIPKDVTSLSFENCFNLKIFPVNLPQGLEQLDLSETSIETIPENLLPKLTVKVAAAEKKTADEKEAAEVEIYNSFTPEQQKQYSEKSRIAQKISGQKLKPSEFELSTKQASSSDHNRKSLHDATIKYALEKRLGSSSNPASHLSDFEMLYDHSMREAIRNKGYNPEATFSGIVALPEQPSSSNSAVPSTKQAVPLKDAKVADSASLLKSEATKNRLKIRFGENQSATSSAAPSTVVKTTGSAAKVEAAKGPQHHN